MQVQGTERSEAGLVPRGKLLQNAALEPPRLLATFAGTLPNSGGELRLANSFTSSKDRGAQPI